MRAALPILVVLGSVALVAAFIWVTEKYLRGRYSKSVNMLISVGFWVILGLFWYLVHALTTSWN